MPYLHQCSTTEIVITTKLHSIKLPIRSNPIQLQVSIHVVQAKFRWSWMKFSQQEIIAATICVIAAEYQAASTNEKIVKIVWNWIGFQINHQNCEGYVQYDIDSKENSWWTQEKWQTRLFNNGSVFKCGKVGNVWQNCPSKEDKNSLN